jgi:SAM-dependent methyltransferase
MKIYTSRSDEVIIDWQWYEPSLRNITWIIVKNLPRSGGKVLDVGCGAGRVCFQLASLGFEVEGIDIEHRVIDVAKELCRKRRANCRFRVGDFRDPKESMADSYDVVICSEVLEHLADYEPLLENIFKSLKRHGTFVLTVPYDPRKFSVLDEYGGHVRRFSYHQIVNILSCYKTKRIIITGFPFYRILVNAYLVKLRLRGGEHSNEDLWNKPSTRLLAKIAYPFCRIDNLFSFTRLGDALIAISEKD